MRLEKRNECKALVKSHKITRADLPHYEFVENFHNVDATELRADAKGFSMKAKRFWLVGVFGYYSK